MGHDFFPLAQSLIDLGNIRRLERRYAEADSLIQEGTDLYVRAQGQHHPNVAFGLAALAKSRYAQGRYDLAEENARKASKIIERLPKSSHYYAGVYTVLGLTLNGPAAHGKLSLCYGRSSRLVRRPRSATTP